mgnify:CR=1 FL=1|jgi:uncharacterized coiled-coil protein SlyX|tara:strand:+ start:165 stop:275 length:111 start_codon:yes stop_codon:yes gene_type:complete
MDVLEARIEDLETQIAYLAMTIGKLERQIELLEAVI